MAELRKNGVRITLDIWWDHAGKATVFSSDDRDLGPKGMIGSFVKGSAAESRAKELLIKYDRLPESARMDPLLWCVYERHSLCAPEPSICSLT
jgi:hypothetical protein